MARKLIIKFIPLKLKISATFVSLSLSLIGIFVLLAKYTFESDKISYVFDSQQIQLDTLSNSINKEFERTAAQIIHQFDEFHMGGELPDDVSIVCISRETAIGQLAAG